MSSAIAPTIPMRQKQMHFTICSNGALQRYRDPVILSSTVVTQPNYPLWINRIATFAMPYSLLLANAAHSPTYHPSFALKHRSELHQLGSDHRLNDQLPMLVCLFANSQDGVERYGQLW